MLGHRATTLSAFAGGLPRLTFTATAARFSRGNI